MNKYFKSLVATLCVLACFFGFNAEANAEVKNVIKGNTSVVVTKNHNGPSKKDLEDIGFDDEILLPKNSSYLSDYQTMYVDAPKGLEVKVLKNYKEESGKSYIYHGTKVTVLAVESTYACIIYQAHNNEVRATWIAKVFLSDEYTGKSYVSGTPNANKKYHNTGCATVEWSDFDFVGTNTKYTVIEETNAPSKKVDAITVDYQVISRQGLKDVSGKRELFINDGEGWISVYTYKLDGSTPVSVTIYFDEPTVVEAVATIPQDEELEVALFRQAVTDVYYAE